MNNAPQQQDQSTWDQRQLIRSALKSWRNPQILDAHPLAQSRAVQSRLQAARRLSMPISRGLILRQLLTEAIEQLRLGGGAPDRFDKGWRPYIILKEQYVEGRHPNYISEQLGIARRTYYKEQDQALGRIAHILNQWEQSYETTEGQPPRILTPFLAPPRPAYALIGRDELLGNLIQRLLFGDNLPSLALNGLPGVGKTALAIELAHNATIRERFQDGILWIGLGRQPDVLTGLGTWGAAVGLSPDELGRRSTVADLAQTIHAAIGLRHMLLIVDDAWTIETALAFKLGGPNCAHVLTTRLPEVALRFSESLTIVVQELSAAAGAELLAQLAPQVVETGSEVAAALAQAVGNLPLALTIIGKYLRVEAQGGQPRRLAAALERLRRAEDRLRLSEPQAPLTRQATLPAGASLSLLASIGLSDDALPATARQVLRALAVFPPKPNTFSEEAAVAVSTQPVETLDILSDHGLLESAGPGRYRLHQVVSDYARLTLTDEAAYQRMAKFYVHCVETHAAEYATFDPEIQNVLAAFQWAFERGLARLLTRGVNAFYRFMEARGLYSLANIQLQRVIQSAIHLDHLIDLPRAMLYLGRTTKKLGNPVQAEEYFQVGLALARQLGDAQITSEILHSISNIKIMYYGEYARAEEYVREGLTLASQIDDHNQISALLMNLGIIAVYQGDLLKADVCLHESLDLAYANGYWERASCVLINLGEVANRRADYEQAEAYWTQSLTLADNIGHKERISTVLIDLATLARRRADYDRAEAYLRESAQLASQIGHSWLLSAAQSEWGELYLAQHNWDAASTAFNQTLTIAQRGQIQEYQAAALYGLARVAAAQGNLADAYDQAQRSLALFEVMGHYLVAEVKLWLQNIQG